MPRFDISVHVLPDFADRVSESWLRRIAEQTLLAGSAAQGAEVSVAVAGDEGVRALNRRHRGLDETTDVLAFSFTHRGEYHGEGERPDGEGPDSRFVLPPGEATSLGEVIISYPQAERQAVESGSPVESELAVLLAHGVLHLLGHDHQEPEDEQAMSRAASQALAGFWEWAARQRTADRT